MIFYTLMKYCYHEDSDQNDGTFSLNKFMTLIQKEKSSTLTNLENSMHTLWGYSQNHIFITVKNNSFLIQIFQGLSKS